jgi:hypothetical protein
MEGDGAQRSLPILAATFNLLLNCFYDIFKCVCIFHALLAVLQTEGSCSC